MALRIMPGIPGAEQTEQEQPLSPALQGLLLNRPAGGQRIGRKEIEKAASILQDYKDKKANLENRIVDDELWWELRHWESIRSKAVTREGKAMHPQPDPSSAWLFNAILNKHADAMDNYPEPVVLPRERSDEQSAKTLSSILPVIMEYNDFEETYSGNWWEKLKHGTAAYGIFWNNELENGLGDVDIKGIDLLNLFWEPGITDIQTSRNLFIVGLVDTELLDEQYPEHAGKMQSDTSIVKQYIYSDTVNYENKSVVVDWYYKVKSPGGRKVLHYAKFVYGCDFPLYATENNPDTAESGIYDHGMYPVVLDTMYPEKGTPVGFGYVSICKDPQLYIDKLSANILETSMMGTKKRYFKGGNTNMDKEQFLDWNEPFVECEGDIDERHLQEITVRPLDGIYVNVLQMKIDELKETAANRDVNSGGVGSGVTAAAAIAALQEAGNKASRDMISASYRAHQQISRMVIELIRQFYDEKRSFRITGQTPGSLEFVEVSNAQLKDQPMGRDSMGEEMFRKPIFDLKIKAQKKNPFSRVSQNEYAKELYGLGFFNPQRAQEALPALDMMEFEGIDKVKEQVMQGETLMNIVQQLSERLNQAMMIMQAAGILPGGAAEAAQQTGQTGGAAPAPGKNPGAAGGENGKIMQSQVPQGNYAEKIAKRSAPDMSAQ